MSKTLAITPSFAAWRRAADRLLTLETAVALRKRTLVFGPPAPQDAEQREIDQVRLLAGELFEIVSRETELARGHPRAAAHA